MNKTHLKVLGIVCLVICAVCIFVAVERYNDNASKVRAMNQMQNSSPLGGMMREMTGQTELKPATPAATKYALVFAALTGIGGVVLLVAGRNTGAKQQGVKRIHI